MKEAYHNEFDGDASENGVPDEFLPVDWFVGKTSSLVKFSKDDPGNYIIRLDIEANVENEAAFAVAKLISIPQIDFCKLIKSIELTSINAPETRSLGYDKSFFVDCVEVQDGIMNFVRTEEKVDGGYYEITEMSVKVDGLKISKIE